ncbi:MAG: XRE family transcriptional regulator [Methylotenera sp.]|nr:XRE family transcriptional regulator [Methylotenera sp.]
MSKKSISLISSNPEALKSLEKLGQRIRSNRVAQGWTIKDMANRLFCSENTYKAIEAGKPTSSIGIIVNALWLFGQIDSIDAIAPVQINPDNLIRVRKQNKTNDAGVISENERDF